MSKLVETLTKQLEVKGNEINKYREKYNLKIKGEESKEMEKSSKDVKTGGVLVVKGTQLCLSAEHSHKELYSIIYAILHSFSNLQAKSNVCEVVNPVKKQ